MIDGDAAMIHTFTLEDAVIAAITLLRHYIRDVTPALRHCLRVILIY